MSHVRILSADLFYSITHFVLRFNLSVLEDWVRINQLDSGNILDGLTCIIQATQLLQVSKSSIKDVDAICEVCNSLNTIQVIPPINAY